VHLLFKIIKHYVHKLLLYERISVGRVCIQCFILTLFDDGFYNAEFMERG